MNQCTDSMKTSNNSQVTLGGGKSNPRRSETRINFSVDFVRRALERALSGVPSGIASASLSVPEAGS